MSEFRNCLIGDIAEIIGGGTPSTKNEENFGGDIAWITPKDLSDHDAMYISKGERSITSSGLKNSSAKLLPANSILFTSRAPIGYIALAENEIATNQGFKSLVLKNDNDPKFFYYLLKNITPQIKSYASGSTFKEISGKVLSLIPIKIPNSNVQKRIGQFLEKFDNKIELNKKNNTTLEDLAKALFKSWFIDFDPVRAKAEDRSTGLPDEISNIFSDSFEDAELGKIPKDWLFTPLDELNEITMGQSPPGSTYNESGNGLPFYQGKTDFGFRHPTQRVFCSEPKRLAEQSSTLISVRAPVGSINLANESCCIGRGVASIKSKKGHHSFTYYLLNGIQSIFDSYNSEGTVFGAINRNDLSSISVIKPPSKVREVFDQFASKIDNKISLGIKEIKLLSSLRDTLLPKLISGELKISDAEEMIEEIGI